VYEGVMNTKQVRTMPYEVTANLLNMAYMDLSNFTLALSVPTCAPCSSGQVRGMLAEMLAHLQVFTRALPRNGAVPQEIMSLDE